MKKFIIVFAVASTLIATTAFARPNYGDNPAQVTFQKEFKGAEDVRWSEGRDVISASFTLSNSRIVAYFNNEGELLGTARNVLFNQLPLAVIREINNRFASAPVYDIIEYTCGGETFYHMDVDTSTKHLKLKVASDGYISIEKKTKK